MKCFFPMMMAAVAGGLVSCSSFSGPLSGGDFDPLTPPGTNRSVAVSSLGSDEFKPGQFVRTAMNDAAFFLKRPKGDADADKLLKMDTQVKVVGGDSTYTKVELDSGEVGFIPSVMLADPAAPAAGLPGSPGETQVYPPLTPLPPVDNSLPVVPPSELPPGGAIPAVVDPSAPAPTTPPGAVPPPAPAEAPKEAPKEAPAEGAKPEEKKPEEN